MIDPSYLKLDTSWCQSCPCWQLLLPCSIQQGLALVMPAQQHCEQRWLKVPWGFDWPAFACMSAFCLAWHSCAQVCSVWHIFAYFKPLLTDITVCTNTVKYAIVQTMQCVQWWWSIVCCSQWQRRQTTNLDFSPFCSGNQETAWYRQQWTAYSTTLPCIDAMLHPEQDARINFARRVCYKCAMHSH